MKAGCRTVAVTLGRSTPLTLKTDNGNMEITAVAYIRDAQNEYFIEAPPVKTTGKIDTTGAGDAFAAGYLFGMVNGKSVEACGQIGHLVAQFAISRMGARQGLPTLAALSKRYQKVYGKPL